MSPLGWHPPYLVDNTDTQYPGDHHWHQCWFFRFFSFFVSVCLYMFQLVCVFVCIFTINLKFLKTHNYWLVQLVYVSLDSGLELKKWKLCIKTFRKFPKKSWGGGEGDLCYPIWLWTTPLKFCLDFSTFFHVTRSFLYQSDSTTFQTLILKTQAILSLNLDII